MPEILRLCQRKQLEEPRAELQAARSMILVGPTQNIPCVSVCVSRAGGSDRLLGDPLPSELIWAPLPSCFSSCLAGVGFLPLRGAGAGCRHLTAPLHRHFTQPLLCSRLLPTNPSPKTLCTSSLPQPGLAHTPLLTSSPVRPLCHSRPSTALLSHLT